MSESHSEIHLTVLPSGTKVQQMRDEAAAAPASPASRNFADQTLIDRAVDPSTTSEQKRITEKVIDAIKRVYDPEIPINIYELGLIYDIAVDPKTFSVDVKMTLTAPGCPVAGELPIQVQQQIESIDEVPSAEVELVWDPPWTRDRMSEAALLQLGML